MLLSLLLIDLIERALIIWNDFFSYVFLLLDEVRFVAGAMRTRSDPFSFPIVDVDRGAFRVDLADVFCRQQFLEWLKIKHW